MADEVLVNMELVVDGASRGFQSFVVGQERKVVLVADVNGAKIELVADASTFGK